MIIIAHRGNIDGRIPAEENKPEYIQKALDMGFDVEVDVWLTKGGWYLGHDSPSYKIDKKVLMNPRVWCHAKNVFTLFALLKNGMHCFFHQTDDVTLTSKGFMWAFNRCKPTPKSIVLFPEDGGIDINTCDICAGVCTDEPARMRELLCVAK